MEGKISTCFSHQVISEVASNGFVKGAALKTAVPENTGTAKVGYTLTAVPGVWTAGTAFSYQWLRNGTPITGATKATYKPVAVDVGRQISVRVTGKKIGHESAVVTSKVTGTAKVAHAVTAQTGTWTSGTTLRYQWLRNGKPIPKATGKTYRPVAADVGRQLSIRVTGTKAGYKTVMKVSPKRAKTLRGTLTGARTTISGTTKVGYTLKRPEASGRAEPRLAISGSATGKQFAVQPRLSTN